MTYFWPLPSASPFIFDDLFYDQIFTSSFQESALTLLKASPSRENYLAFRRGHLVAFQAYLDGTYERANFASLKAENKALENVAKAADKFLDSLLNLQGNGKSASRLVREIKRNPTHYLSDRGTKIADLLDDHRMNNELFSLRSFISDIWVSAERAQIKKPVEVSKFDLLTRNMGANATNPSKEFLEALSEAVFDYDWNRTDDFEGDLKRWNERVNARKVPKDFPLTQFIVSFDDVWSIFSNQKPATQGHHYSEIGQTSSVFVDLIYLSLRQHDAPFTRQNIVTAIRKLPVSQT